MISQLNNSQGTYEYLKSKRTSSKQQEMLGRLLIEEHLLYKKTFLYKKKITDQGKHTTSQMKEETDKTTSALRLSQSNVLPFCSYAVIKDSDHKQYTGGNDLFGLYFQVTVCHWGKSGQGLKQEMKQKP